jgi:hypothetical protein
MRRNRSLIIGIALAATAGFVALQNGFAPTSDSVTQTPIVTDTATSAPVDEPCGYVWVHHNAPELTSKIDTAVRAINPDASARAELFGEDCVYADGRSTFGAMETDFYVNLPAEDLTNEEAFGNWMAQVLPIVVQIPREEIQGWMAQVLPIVVQIPREEIQGNYGFVELWFEKSDAEHLIVRVLIQKYIDETQGKTGAELFNMFYAMP